MGSFFRYTFVANILLTILAAVSADPLLNGKDVVLDVAHEARDLPLGISLDGLCGGLTGLTCLGSTFG